MPKLVLKSDVAVAPDLLWQSIRRFSAIAAWNPLVRDLQADGDTVGSVRELELEGAGHFVERLEELDDGARLYSYSVVASPFSVENCIVQVRVEDRGDNTSTVEWTSTFESQTQTEFKTVRSFQQIYQSALDNIAKQFSDDNKP